MQQQEIKAYLLLKSVIFHFHGLDDAEKKILHETAAALDAQEELQWAQAFVAEDVHTAFARARQFLKDPGMRLEKSRLLKLLIRIWEANLKKGYISEMEATAVIKLAEDHAISTELLRQLES